MEHIKRFLIGLTFLAFCGGVAFGLVWVLENYAIYFFGVTGLIVTYLIGFVLRKIQRDR
ncbi:hypothetical protein LCGC14_2986170 [marine sediment metagenome]|uniref:Uncharacterized protein n=1 Tax=marine sediment metagenome TaxID=412755 RepID=A0A0F8X552_9ZZZZ